MLNKVYVPLELKDRKRLERVAEREERDPRRQAALYIREALELEEDDIGIDNLLGLNLTLGNLEWLKNISDDELAIIKEEIIPMFELYYKTRDV